MQLCQRTSGPAVLANIPLISITVFVLGVNLKKFTITSLDTDIFLFQTTGPRINGINKIALHIQAFLPSPFRLAQVRDSEECDLFVFLAGHVEIHRDNVIGLSSHGELITNEYTRTRCSSQIHERCSEYHFIWGWF